MPSIKDETKITSFLGHDKGEIRTVVNADLVIKVSKTYSEMELLELFDDTQAAQEIVKNEVRALMEAKVLAYASAVSDGPMNLNGYRDMCHTQAAAMGWWQRYTDTGLDPTAEKLLLIVSEICEGMEGARKNLMDDHLPDRKMEEVELADALIRIFDYAGYRNFDLEGAVRDKLAYNRKRADHQPENREKEHGKKW